MKKKTVKLTETDLRKMISESVRKAINEGHWNGSVYDKWEEIRNAVGDDTFISELYNYMDGDEIEGFIETISRNYDLDYNEDEEY